MGPPHPLVRGLFNPGGSGDYTESDQTITYTITDLPEVILGTIELEDGNAITVNGEYSIEQIQNLRFTPALMALVVVTSASEYRLCRQLHR